jgi:hypothetical protein
MWQHGAGEFVLVQETDKRSLGVVPVKVTDGLTLERCRRRTEGQCVGKSRWISLGGRIQGFTEFLPGFEIPRLEEEQRVDIVSDF